MEIVNELIERNDHEQILQLEGEKYAPYKCIAYIFLENYHKALEIVEKNSYEHCYVLYKLEKYKKCIRTLKKYNNKRTSEGGQILLAQCLYKLGYFTAAYNILSRYNKTSININLIALKSYISAFQKAILPTKHLQECKDEHDCDLFLTDKFKFIGEEEMEAEYNRAFEYLYDEKEYKKVLENSEHNELCNKQYNNIVGNFDDNLKYTLSKTQTDIWNDNKKYGTPTHIRLPCKANREFSIFLHQTKKKFDFIFYRVLNPITPNLTRLSIYYYIKKGDLSKAKILHNSLPANKRNSFLTFLIEDRSKINEEDIRKVLSLP